MPSAPRPGPIRGTVAGASALLGVLVVPPRSVETIIDLALIDGLVTSSSTSIAW